MDAPPVPPGCGKFQLAFGRERRYNFSAKLICLSGPPAPRGGPTLTTMERRAAHGTRARQTKHVRGLSVPAAAQRAERLPHRVDGPHGGPPQGAPRGQLHRLLPPVPLSAGEERGRLRRLRPLLPGVLQGRALSAGGVPGAAGLAGPARRALRPRRLGRGPGPEKPGLLRGGDRADAEGAHGRADRGAQRGH